MDKINTNFEIDENAILYGKLEPDDDDIRGNDSGDEDSHIRILKAPPEDESKLKMPKLRSRGNAGVKSVLADYAEAKERARLRHIKEQTEKIKIIENSSFTVTPQRYDPTAEIKEEINDLDDNEDILATYREQRMKELKAQLDLQKAQLEAAKVKRPTFGFLQQISPIEYAPAIDKEKNDVYIVAHLYQPYIPTCVRLNTILRLLAVKYPYVKFLNIISTEAKKDYPDVALPTVIIYKAGQLIRSFIPITESIVEDFEYDDIEYFFLKYGILIK